MADGFVTNVINLITGEVWHLYTMTTNIVENVLKGCVIMRNANSIYPFSTILASEWMKVPDMRFGQLIENLSSFARTKYGKKDLFYIEDEEFISMLKEYLQHCK
jgi:hypothetical protein